MFLCRSIDNFVQAYRDMSPARVAMTNTIKRSFTQMAVVSFSDRQYLPNSMLSFIWVPLFLRIVNGMKTEQIQGNCPLMKGLRDVYYFCLF